MYNNDCVIIKKWKNLNFCMGLQKYLTEKQWDLQSLSFCYLHNIVNISQFCSQPQIKKKQLVLCKIILHKALLFSKMLISLKYLHRTKSF